MGKFPIIFQRNGKHGHQSSAILQGFLQFCLKDEHCCRRLTGFLKNANNAKNLKSLFTLQWRQCFVRWTSVEQYRRVTKCNHKFIGDFSTISDEVWFRNSAQFTVRVNFVSQFKISRQNHWKLKYEIVYNDKLNTGFVEFHTLKTASI